MLKHLRIQNLILVEEVSFSFCKGLNILTGETGSGKSAIMHGLSLIIGERTDTSLIRKGCEKATVEAVFETKNPILTQLLSEGGIDLEENQEIIIRREISLSGKGRVFINHQLAQLSFLKKLGSQLVQMVAQHANQSLYSLDYHREIIDLYGNLHPLLHHFQQSYDHEMKIKRVLEEMIKQEGSRLREIDRCEKELEELENAHLKEGEEEELFAEYTLLSHAEEISQKISEINQVLTGDRNPLLTQLYKQKQGLESILRFDSTLQEPSQALQNVTLELEEIAYSLQRYQNNLNFDPNRLACINERLTLLNHLKKKYGSSVEDILNYKRETEAKLIALTNADVEVENLQQQLREAQLKSEKLAKELSAKRRSVADHFETAITHHLHSLNMAKAVFSVEIAEQQRSRFGDDHLEFFLCPNPGEHQISLKEGASGGEMSRVLLSLQTLLAGKEQRDTLLFDEVDANIGGETATIVGDKLREISQQHQVICITHFPQVAMQADGHFQISKEEKEGRTVTLVKELNAETRQLELSRMAGQASSILSKIKM